MSPRYAFLLRVQAVLVLPIVLRWAWAARAQGAIDPAWDDHGLFPGMRGSA